MKIPERLEKLLLKPEASDIRGALYSSLSAFEPWIADNKLPFFPEYTDHGINHIEAVFETAESLIREEAWGVFTAADSATMLLAILLHDSAMHLTPDSFIALIDDQNTDYRVEDLDIKTWCQLWDDFLIEAYRFDGRKLTALFGDTDPVQVPQLHPDKMTGRDRKLIGEFLRRYHHRLAHEIAIFGVPSPDTDTIELDEGLPNDIADLAGLVARSHGLPVRSCLPYLESRYALREYKQIHAVFLMVLLRIADYLQIQPQRAPKQILKVTKLRSPVSKGEWDFHHAIETVEYHDDPESLFVVARPKEVKSFVKIQDWLASFQAELDTSWAVLGEVYGPFARRDLNKLGIVLRRISSNLDDLERFSRQVTYIPVHTAFSTADPHVLNLLVGPLYNNDPAFGIRELIQNAVDAVRELQEYKKNHPELRKYKLLDQKSDVFVSIDKNPSGDLWLTVSDRGIGMTPKVIREYFLSAGASFRESDIWRKEFAEKEGKSRVIRSGRFGIGVLAGFLIGSEMHVSTRHVGALPKQGIEFTATLDTDTIELKRTSGSIGTKIRIKVFDRFAQKYNQEDWRSAMDWYYLSEPSVRFQINGKEVKPKYNLPIPMLKTLPFHWRRSKHPDYRDIHWTYANAPALSCNGLKVIESRTKSAFDISPQDDITGSIRIPNLSIFDPDGKLPLNLQRTNLKEDTPFEQELRRDILRDFLSFILVYAPTSSMTDSSTWDFYQYLAYPGLDTPIRHLAPWFCTQRGVCIVDSWHISQIRPKSVMAFFLNPENKLLQDIEPNISVPLIGLQWPPIERYFGDPSSPTSILCSLLLRGPDPELHRVPSTSGIRVLLPTGFLSLLRNHLSYISSRGTTTSENADIFQKFVSRCSIQLHGDPKTDLETDHWCLFSMGNCPELSPDFRNIIQKVSQKPLKGPSILAEWYLLDPKPDVRFSPVSKAWMEIIRDPIIPYDPKERRKNLTHAFEDLAPYVEAHEEGKNRDSHPPNSHPPNTN